MFRTLLVIQYSFSKTAFGLCLLLASLFAETLTAAVSISDFQPLSITALQTDQQLQLEFGDHTLVLNLRPNDALLNQLQVSERQALTEAGQQFYTGSVVGVPASWVRLSRINGQWSGGVFDGEQLLLVDSALSLAAALPDDRDPGSGMVIYRLTDFRLDAPADTTGIVPPGEQRDVLTGEDILAALLQLNQRGQLERLPVTIVTDTQFNGIHGSNVVAVVMSRLNFVDGLYVNQVGVGLLLEHLEQLGNNGTLTSTDAEQLLVNQFRPFMTSGAGSSIPNNGVAHLFTGRNLDGSTVGIAYLGVLCSSGFGYGVDQNFGGETTSSLIFAHELGHNFDAPHDGEDECINETFNGIMNPSINGSQVFSDCSLAQMAPEVAAASCLIAQTETFFTDGFEQ